MGNKRADKFCTSIKVCVNNEINDAIEKHQAHLRIKDEKIRKNEAADKWIEMLFNKLKQLDGIKKIA